MQSLGAPYFAIPEDGEPVIKTHALKLLNLLCQPFSSVNDINHEVEENLNENFRGESTSYAPFQLADDLSCQTEQNKSIHWQLANMRITASSAAGAADFVGIQEESIPLSSHFLGSMQPNGWAFDSKEHETNAEI